MHQSPTRLAPLQLFLLHTHFRFNFPAQFSTLVRGEPSPGDSRTGGDGQVVSEFASSPKRQYLIAPRIGRSTGGAQHQTIWSALEEASFNLPGQIQPNRGFPGPLKGSSLMFLINQQPNRRLIGPRSGGLLPQARIGRRSAPIGLMPQPRVGRRSDQLYDSQPDLVVEGDLEGGSGQQEVAVATLSDTSPFNDALEAFLSG